MTHNIDLDEWYALPAVLIVEAVSGACYHRQAGGTYCAQPFLEGYLDKVPTELVHWVLADGEAYRTGFRDDWYNAGDDSTFLPTDDKRLASTGFPMEYFDAERAATIEWGEAWIPVLLPDGRRAILSYENSD